MDDSQDKVRRNLVAVAAAIVFIQFLNIQFVPETSVGVLRIPKISEFRLWALMLVVLSYFFQRYWFDNATKEQRADAWAEYIEFRGKGIHKMLLNDALSSVINGQRPQYFVDLSRVLNDFHAPNYPADTYDRIHVDVAAYGGDGWKLKAPNANVRISRIKDDSVISTANSD